ncbi:MAG: hypothetical protein RI939_799, partial [Actinomycetota bacterium]
METLIVILLVALIAAVLLIGLRIAKPQQAPAVQTPQVTVTAPPLPVQDIVSAVQAAINATAISSDIRGAVSAEILEVAQRALQSNTELLTVQAGQVLET